MILSEDIVRQVLAGKRTMVRLPIKTRPCPYKEGRAYAVKTYVPCVDCKGMGVVSVSTKLSVFEEGVAHTRGCKRCKGAGKLRDPQIRCHITIANVTEALIDNQNVWVIRFQKGDHTDKPRLLKARPGGEQYTHVPALALRHELEAVSEQLLQRYAENGRERHADVLAEQRERALKAIGEIKRHAPSGKARKRLTSAEHQIRAQQAESV